MDRLDFSDCQLGLPPDWRLLNDRWLASAAATSFGLHHFYLLAPKPSNDPPKNLTQPLLQQPEEALWTTP